MDVKTFGVVGAGQMGSGIAQVAAASGLPVVMLDVKDEFVSAGHPGHITQPGSNGKKREDVGGGPGRRDGDGSRAHTDFQDVSDVDFVVEAATEREDLKLEIFRQLDRGKSAGRKWFFLPTPPPSASRGWRR